jgi:hypothetical protein
LPGSLFAVCLLACALPIALAQDATQSHPAPALASEPVPELESAHTPAPAPPRAPVRRVLLLGNSYTRFNVMPRMLRFVARGAGIELRTEAIAHAGYTLRRHWRVRETRQLVRSGRYSHVVLQGHSLRPVDRPAEFADYGERLTRAVRDAGAEPILYETWPRHPKARLYREHAQVHSPPQMASQVGEAYRRLAQLHGARVAPVGRAFLSALSAAPEIVLYKPDGTHPTYHGSYLAACVLFGAITGVDPRTTSYVPWELRDGGAEALRELAAATLASE